MLSWSLSFRLQCQVSRVDGVRGGTHLSLCSKQPLWGLTGLRSELTALPCRVLPGHTPGYVSILQGFPGAPQSCFPPQPPGTSPLILFLVLWLLQEGRIFSALAYMNSFVCSLLELDMLVLLQ